eukprot:6747301-Prymnesium_polylepis.3
MSAHGTAAAAREWGRSRCVVLAGGARPRARAAHEAQRHRRAPATSRRRRTPRRPCSYRHTLPSHSRTCCRARR